MDPSFSLEYYDRIFRRRTPEFWELIAELSRELQVYAENLERALLAQDRQEFSRLRHSYRPVILNLELGNLRSLETAIAQAFEEEASAELLAALALRFRDQAEDVARTLSQIRYG